MLFGINLKSNKENINSIPKILRTQLQSGAEMAALLQDFAVNSLTYQGSFPASRFSLCYLLFFVFCWEKKLKSKTKIGMFRLSAQDPMWDPNFRVNLTAITPFEPGNPKLSHTPGFLFIFDFINTGNDNLTVDLLFNFPSFVCTYKKLCLY